jgi:hypothetical protein
MVELLSAICNDLVGERNISINRDQGAASHFKSIKIPLVSCPIKYAGKIGNLT